MSEPIQYPRRLYLAGEVIEGDLHAANSVVVDDAEQEAEARAKGYRKAYESDGGNGGSPEPVSSFPGSTSDELSPNQGDVAVTSADPDDEEDQGSDVDDIEALRLRLIAAGVKVDKRWKEGRLRDELAKVE